jgi:predicted ATPase/DNA-binding CsgD family transcriptional regulator
MTTLTTFPIQPTTFVGRDKELADITQSLRNPSCRLLTISGPGGVGKTRLAVQVVRSITDHFKQGTFFINLQPVETANHLVSAIADSLDIPLSGQDEPSLQLCNYLGDKEMLLVLDNFETLLTDTNFVSLLLKNVPKVKLIITSRQALNLRGEWLYPISGMSYPNEGGLHKTGDYDAVQFFTQCAQRVRPDFSSESERKEVIRICQLVDGLPLALEIAASWTKILGCVAIADQIQKDIEFLTSNLQDAPPQHRSMLAVFDQSWNLLSEDERSIFKRLSVFRGGFDLRAARKVTDASPSLLAGLVDKSIIRVESEGRFQIHELSRQYAKEKLEQDPEGATQARDRFGRHYIEYIHSLEGDLIAGRQRKAILEVKVELENIRKAWEWAITNANIDSIAKSVMSLSLFYQYQSRYLEGNRMLEEAETVLREKPPSKQRDLILVAVLSDLAWLRIRLGKFDQAEAGLIESMALLEKHKARPILGNCFDPRVPLGVITSIRGDTKKTASLAKQVLQVSQSQGEIWNEMDSYYLLTRAAILESDFENAQDYAQQTYRIAKDHQEDWFMAYCLNELGAVAAALGDYGTARGHFQASYQLREEFNDPEGMAVALNHLGGIALREEDFIGAGRYFQQSQEIYQEINDQGGLATSLNGLARAALAQDELLEARERFLTALQISSEIQYLSLTLTILVGIAHLLLQAGETRDVHQILTLIKDNPASEKEAVEQARKLARDYNLDLSSYLEQSMDLDGYISHLLLWLPVTEIKSTPQTTSSSLPQSLIDPLTERELEVLHLIAAGLTNQQIAETLIISPGTAKWYTSQIYSKLGVRKRTQAVARARELKIIP